eukprot:Rhum_TRINITY_DN14668_c17_g1::Rhum_TRINITY_DN14668_c17_g1_i1::g.109368::m.109368
MTGSGLWGSASKQRLPQASVCVFGGERGVTKDVCVCVCVGGCARVGRLKGYVVRGCFSLVVVVFCVVVFFARTVMSTWSGPSASALAPHVVELRRVEAVELRCRGNRVGAEVMEHHPVAKLHLRELDALSNAVESVAGGAEDRRARLLHLSLRLVRGVHEEGLRLDHGVVEEEAVERLVHTFVQVVLRLLRLRLLALLLEGDLALREDVRRKGVRCAREVATRLGDDADRRREQVVEHRRQLRRDLGEGGTRLLVAGEAAADVQEAHVEALLLCHVEHTPGVARRRDECAGVAAAGADVEADAHEVEAEVGADVDKLRHVSHLGAVFRRELAHALRVISGNAQHDLGIGPVLLDLGKLPLVVKCDVLQSVGLGSFDV